MKGTKIIVTDQPKGTFKECTIVGTPKPGTVMEIDPTVAPVGNVFSWQAAGTQADDSAGLGMTADGDSVVIAILTEDTGQDKTYNEAYAAGDRGYLYFPANGEEFNMILENQAGTADDFEIGDPLMVDDGTGKLLRGDTNAERYPFVELENHVNLTADTLTWCMYSPDN